MGISIGARSAAVGTAVGDQGATTRQGSHAAPAPRTATGDGTGGPSAATALDELRSMSASFYEVQAGDWLSSIAAQLGVGVDELYALNRETIGPDPDCIQPGMRLLIPGSPIARMQQALAAPAGANAAPEAPEAATGTNRDALVSQLRELLVSRGSPMAESVEALVDAATRHGVDPRLMVAIAGQESEFGTTNPGSLANNPFGFLWNGDLDSPFESWEAGYEQVATRLGEMIHDEGFTSVYSLAEGNPDVANDGYCEVGATNDPSGLNGGWIGGVSAMYRQLGGDPENVTAGGGGAVQAAPATQADAGGDEGGSSASAPPAEADEAFVTQFVSDYNAEGPWGSKDCGPASLLMALRLAGAAPGASAGADANGDGTISDMDAIRDMRFRMTGQWETTETDSSQVRAVLDDQGVAHTDIDGGGDAAWSQVQDAAATGAPIVLSGHTRSIADGTAWGNGYDVAPGGDSEYRGDGAHAVGHFITVTDYDPATDTFLVLDPMVASGPLRVSSAEVRAFWEGGPSATVVGA